jgi:hypothetical protein
MIRNHWQIENNLHWVMDMTFRQDECRIRTGFSAANFATIKHAGFCRKVVTWLKKGLSLTHLCCEGSKLLERWNPVCQTKIISSVMSVNWSRSNVISVP